MAQPTEWTTEELTEYLEGFSKFALDLWFNVNQRLEKEYGSPKIDTMKLDRQQKNQKKAEYYINSQRDLFKDITINGVQISVLISSDGYVVVNYIDYIDKEDPEKDQTIFLVFKVIKENNQYKLEITGLDYTYNKIARRHIYRQGCKAEYLVNFFEQYGVAIPGHWRKNTPRTDDKKADKFNRYFVNSQIIQGQRIFEKEEALNGQNAYFKFYLKLINEVKTKQDIEANIQFYRDTITGYDPTQRQPEREPIFINDALPADSPYYIERSLIDERCKTEILKPRAYIRLRSSHKTGKTSVLYRLIEFANQANYSTVFINFLGFSISQPNIKKDNHFKAVCQWLCQEVARQLGKEDKTNSTDYFQQSEQKFVASITEDYFYNEFLQGENNPPLLLAMDNVDKVFDDRQIAENLCAMWHTWHEQAGNTDYGQVWSKLRIVFAHATEVYLDLSNINRSPCLSIGYVPDRSVWDWKHEEINKFSKIYRINLAKEETKKLIELTGGHPYLVRLAVEYLYEEECTIEDLLKIAVDHNSPFANYLEEEILCRLKMPENQKYESAFYKVIHNQPFNINNFLEQKEIDFKLEAMGLIKPKTTPFNKSTENPFLPASKLYSDFLKDRLNEYE